MSHNSEVFVINLPDMFSVGLIMPQLGNFAIKLGCNQLQIGTMGALYSAFQLISGPMIGTWSDLKGRKPTLILSLVLCAFAYVVLGFTTTILTFFAVRSFLGIVKQTQLLVKALAPDYEIDSSEQAAVFGKLAALSSVGMSLGPIIGGHIMEVYPENGFTVITCCSGLLFIVNASLIICLPDTNKEKEENKKDNRKVAPCILKSVINSVKESVEEFYKVDWSIYWDVFLFKLLITLCMGTYFGSYGIFLKKIHAASPKYLGYIIAFQGGIGALCTYFIGHINQLYKNDKDFSKRLYHIFTVLTLGLLGMALAPNLLCYVVFTIPLALSGAMGRIIGLEMIMNKGESDRRGALIGATSSVRSLSGVVTPMFVGIIGEYLGIQYVLYFAALFAVMGILTSYIIGSQTVLKNKAD
ncbi:major facilitator superfamily domain-containing protein 9-like isoform X2 [Galleria mellonella]|uniref:Major facilitator superfamily domain-containing protein 9-like isoform X2 n=1 Tax=Galleria mellonella TaxID=7137 RepID=A0A6J3C9W7_GALME|nr:major facilitator superfamily domain-containing protein 9-like isoform X2 [Galleria mellonella]